MKSRLNPYLVFPGNARQAMEFYQTVFGGDLQISTFGEAGMAGDPAQADKVMHAMLQSPEELITFMASDAPLNMPTDQGSNIAMSLSGDHAEQLTAYFEMLSEFGKVREPLVKAPWGDTFGMCTDQFGIEWMVNIADS